MKVAIVTWWPHPQSGGITTHIELLAQSLRALGHRVEIIGGEPYHAAASFSDAQALLARKLTEKVRKRALGVDVVLAEDALSAVAVRDILHWTDVPLVLTVHGYLAYEEEAAGFCVKGDAVFTHLMAAEYRAYRAADAVVCVDERISQYVGQIRSERTAVIENAVDDRLLQPPLPEEKQQYRRRLGFSDRPIVACARRLTAKNGVRYAIEALTLMPESLRPELVIAGDGEERERLENLAAELNLSSGVRFLGSVPHQTVLDLYRAADIAVVPSVSVAGVEEASSLSALEAMALGVPLIASAVGGLRRIGQDGGALLVPPADAAALADAAAKLLQGGTLRSRQSQLGRNTVVARYGRESWIAAHLSVMEEAIKRQALRHGEKDVSPTVRHGSTTKNETASTRLFEKRATTALARLEQGVDDPAWQLVRSTWRTDGTPASEPILMVGPTVWSSPPQRQQHLALELGNQGRLTIYLEPDAAPMVLPSEAAGQEVRAVLEALLRSAERMGPNCFRLPLPRHVEDADGRRIANDPQLVLDVLKRALACERPWGIFCRPEHARILDAMGGMGLVAYDTSDQTKTTAEPGAGALEQPVLDRSDVIFVASEALPAEEAFPGRRAYCVPTGATAQQSWVASAQMMLAIMEGHHALLQAQWEDARACFVVAARSWLPQRRLQLDADLAAALAGERTENASAEVHSLGIEWASRGRLHPAEALFRQWTGLVPEDSDAWFNLASVQARLGEWDDAINSLARCSLVADPDEEVLALFATALLSGGYLSSALRVAEEALQLHSGRQDIQEMYEMLRALPDPPADSPLVGNLITRILDRARSASPRAVWDRIFGAMDAEAVEVPSALALELGTLVQTLLPRGGSLLEAGSGSGGLSAYLAKLGYRTTLLDQSAAALALARRVYESLGLQGQFFDGDLFRMPFADDEFDCVWNSGVMEHFSDEVIVQGLKEMARVSRRHVVVLVPNAACVFYRASKWALEQNGTWPVGDEFPRYSTASLFEQAGLKVLREDYLAMDEGIRWLRHLDGADEKTLAILKAWTSSLDPVEPPLRQALSYLLVTIGEKT